MNNKLQELTRDSILDGKIELLQPKNGYRVAIDPIVLSSFVKLKRAQTVLDVGCGTGAISLILKMLEPSSKITAIDIDSDICSICRQNSQMNSLDLEVIEVAIEKINEHSALRNRCFDHVVTNPPYFRTESSNVSSATKQAKFETLTISKWITFCIKKLNHNGMFSIIHDASRVDDIVCSLKSCFAKVGSIEIIPIFSKSKNNAKRVVIRCRKNSKESTKITPGIIVHNDDGKYSEFMTQILSGTFITKSS